MYLIIHVADYNICHCGSCKFVLWNIIHCALHFFFLELIKARMIGQLMVINSIK